jgi:multidrug resistance efflux pump
MEPTTGISAGRQESHKDSPMGPNSSLEYWCGRVDQKLETYGNGLERMQRAIEQIPRNIAEALETIEQKRAETDRDFEKRLRDLETNAVFSKTKFAIITAALSIIAGGLSSAIFSAISHRLFGS